MKKRRRCGILVATHQKRFPSSVRSGIFSLASLRPAVFGKTYLAHLCIGSAAMKNDIILLTGPFWDGGGFGAAAEGGCGQSPRGAAFAKGNHDDLELDRQTTQHGCGWFSGELVASDENKHLNM